MLPILALSFLSLASAFPAFENKELYPEVVPGPGLPSLQELGVTSAELYARPLPNRSEALEARRALFDPYCGPDEPWYTNVNGIIACYHFLYDLGDQPCTIDGEKSQFCHSGDAAIMGQPRDLHYASSSCRDVADGVLWAINGCTRGDQSCAGVAAARGNGDLIVGSGATEAAIE